ncbi:methyltransferase domain-containing protein [Streptomyces nigra]|uniref:methyltransferase domain-containing protein n=1 Tax=Streptomyces TaxID=1883 RepID=UPI00363EB6C0
MPVEVIARRAEELRLKEDGFDVAVCSLMLCTITDEPGAQAEVWQVLDASRSRPPAVFVDPETDEAGHDQ